MVVAGADSDEAAGAFTTWTTLRTDALHAHDAPPDKAEHLATLTVAAVEGAIVLCRAYRDTTPLDHVSDLLQTLIESAVR